ncbi:hypothetical protein [Pseudomonas brenneri]|uniref:hypothetical protein n=1 Tax=Pseudomonas brenneri TaxID=129817 RepID=UPI003B9E8472
MGKRKVYVKSDISTIKVEHHHDDSGKVIILPEVIPPAQTFVIFPSNIRNRANFDFAPWYGLNIDELTYACQRQIERFLDKQDSEVATLTVLGYCSDGLKYFLDYAAMLAQALARPILLGCCR